MFGDLNVLQELTKPIFSLVAKEKILGFGLQRQKLYALGTTTNYIVIPRFKVAN